MKSKLETCKRTTKITMPAREPPQVLRVKRRRDEDPLEALVFETEKRRQVKRPRFVFTLQRTEQNDINDSTQVLQASQKRSKDARPVFKLQSGPEEEVKPKLDEGPQELNPDLLDMLNDYLKTHDETSMDANKKPLKRRQSSVISQDGSNGSGSARPKMDFAFPPSNGNSNSVIDEEEEGDADQQDPNSEYVYDVYYRDKAVGAQLKTEKIGYIRFDDDELGMLLDESELDYVVSDDEDSNDENFYRNDYPDDEDGGYESDSAISMGMEEPSDDQDDEFDIMTNRRRFSRLDFERSEGVVGLGPLQPLENDVAEQKIIDDTDGDINMDNADDTADGNTTLDTIGQRHQFFANENDDPIAMHRDRIFNKLQNMIDES